MRIMRNSVLLVLFMIAAVGSLFAQTVITPTSGSYNATVLSSRGPDKAYDGSGLSGVGEILTQTHDNVRNNQFGGAYNTAANILTYGFSSAADIDGVHIWNSVEIAARGLQRFDLYFSTDGGSTYPDHESLSGYTKGSGSTASVQSRYFTARAGVTHVQLRNMVNWGDASWVYLPEIRFDEALAGGTPVLSSLNVSAVTATNAQISAELSDADADVTLYWVNGTVSDPATHPSWDGTNGPVSATTGTAERTASNLLADTQYSYAFYATNDTFGTESWSASETFVTPLTDAQAPTFASALSSIASVTLEWSANDSFATGYVLQRSTSSSSGPYTYIDVGDVTSYMNRNLSPGTTYYYAVAATNSNDGSSTSFSQNQTNATPTALTGDLIAEYTFDGALTSSDLEPTTTASDITFAGLPDPEYATYLQIGAEEFGSAFPGGANDYFTFTLSIGEAAVSLTALTWDFGLAGGYNYQMGMFSDAYLGFSGAGNYIPGTYESGGTDVNIDITGNSLIADLTGIGGFQNLSNTSVTFRVYLADGASSTSREYRFDNIRVYADVPEVVAVALADPSVGTVTTNSAALSVLLIGTNADVTAFWDTDAVVDPATHTGWGGSHGPVSASTGTVDRTAAPLSPDTTYTAAFFATNNSAGLSDWSSTIQFTTPFSDAQAPAFTSAVASLTSVNLGWEVNDTHATGYILRTSTNSSGGPYTYVEVGDVTSYTLSGLLSGATYYYALAATNSGNGSATGFASAQTNATTAPITGSVVAEYLFSGDYSSSDETIGSTASDISANGHTPTTAANYYEADCADVGTYLSGGDYLSFTINVAIGSASLTAIEWYYGTHNEYVFQAGIFASAYKGFGSPTDVIPGTYEAPPNTAPFGPYDNFDVATNRKIADLSSIAEFQNLSGTNIEFRIYIGDEAGSSGRKHRFDNIRVYADVFVPGEVTLSSPSAASVTENAASLSVTLSGTNADVSAYWDIGTVENPATHTGWDGTNTIADAATGSVTRTATGLLSDSIYSFAFFATNTIDGPTDWSDVGVFTTQLSAAEAPVITTATPTAIQIELVWTELATHETGYLLRRSADSASGPWDFLTNLAANATSFVDDNHGLGLADGTTYYYQLAATNSSNQSATPFADATTNATTITVTLPPVVDRGDGPTPGAGTATLSGRVVSGTGLTDVRIYFGSQDGGTNNPGLWDTNFVFDAASISAGSPFATNATDLVYGLTYYYRVYAANAAGAAWSAATNFTTQIPVPATGMVPATQFTSSTVASSDDFDTARAAEKAFNGAGLTGDLHTTGIPGRSDSWMSAGPTPANEWLKVDLGATYRLDHLKVWNWQDGTSRSITQADIYIATSDPGNNSDQSGAAFNPAGWTLINENQTFNTGTGITDPSISLGGVNAAYMAVKVDASGGDASYVGLAEMQIFWSEPDPISLAPAGVVNITDTQADLVGTLTADGATFTVVAYVSETNHAGSAAWLADGTKSIIPMGSFTNVNGASITGTVGSLTADTTYYYTLVASNALTNIWADSNASFSSGMSAAHAPAFTNATPDVSDIALGWIDNADSETGYVLRRSSVSATGPWSFYTNLPADTVAYTDDNAGAGLTAGVTYYYQLAATNSNNQSSTLFADATASATMPIDLVWTLFAPETDPIGPEDATATATINLDLDNCVLVWDTSDKGTGSTGAWSGSNVVGATNGAPNLVVTAELTGLSPDTSYTWRFYGTNDTYGLAAWSDPVTFITAASAAQAPTITRSEAPSFSHIELEWLDKSAGETAYILRRSTTSATGPWSVTLLPANTTNYTDSAGGAGLLPGTTYYYQVASSNSGNGSVTDFALAAAQATTEPIRAAFDVGASPVQSGAVSFPSGAQWTVGGDPAPVTSVGVTLSVVVGNTTYYRAVNSPAPQGSLAAMMSDVWLWNHNAFQLTLSGLEPYRYYPLTIYSHDDASDGAIIYWHHGADLVAAITNKTSDYTFHPSYAGGTVIADATGTVVLDGSRSAGYGMFNGLVVHDPMPVGTVFRFR